MPSARRSTSGTTAKEPITEEPEAATEKDTVADAPQSTEPEHAQIAQLAYRYSLEREDTDHHSESAAVEDWLRAERELRGE